MPKPGAGTRHKHTSRWPADAARVPAGRGSRRRGGGLPDLLRPDGAARRVWSAGWAQET